MLLTRLTIAGFKSFAKRTTFDFASPVVGIVGPNGSGKSNVAEAIRFVLGEQSMKSMRGKRGEDLIWNGSPAAPRASRGAVEITFNNASRFLPLDFDEVTIERVVARDGINEYRLNGSTVRLKDVLELLASANIGESGHHIISQGEADKILSASPRDRRGMLEDALGLTVYQFKKEESVRKLERTEENMRQVEALRREVAPHLKFLKKQVEKLERAQTLRAEAVPRFRAYFAREEAYLSKARSTNSEARNKSEQALKEVVAAIADAQRALAGGTADQGGKRIVELSEELERARAARAAAARAAARCEGQLEALEKASAEAGIPAAHLSQVIGEAEVEFVARQSTLADAVAFVVQLFKRLKALAASAAADAVIADLRQEKRDAEGRERTAAGDEKRLADELEMIRRELDRSREQERISERHLFELTSREREIRHALATIDASSERLALEEAEFKRDLAEAAPLIGREILSYEPMNAVPREEQEREKRELEKIKIRLEEIGGGGGDDVMKEYREVSEREQFLQRELDDLTQSAGSLKALITELEAELGTKFKDGLSAVNKEFARLFAILFDGGTASLVVTREAVRTHGGVDGDSEHEDDGETAPLKDFVEGIDIALSIPRKRVKSLTMLSGGERALTSIALIFAMSSVNPPPFLVLDETDAALDEANSKRYGDMVAHLADKSQLVVITHNRETMSRAGILYGVTMGGDGVSKILSVKLEEAIKVAK